MADAPLLLDNNDVQFHFRPTDEIRSVVNYNGSNWTVVGNIEKDAETKRSGPPRLDSEGNQSNK